MKNKGKYVYLGLGSNLRSLSYGSSADIITASTYRLKYVGLRLIKLSKIWITSPVPYQQNPFFYNAVAKCIIVNRQAFDPIKLLQGIKYIENIMGRRKNNKSISRIIDIDILDYDRKILNIGILLPHPRLHERKFVLEPLQSIEKNWKHPKYKIGIKEMRAKSKDNNFMYKI
tara:strand:- start:1260 stop:1775 length:516 start_codon:yes stop_codon:yes gene_type:complete